MSKRYSGKKATKKIQKITTKRYAKNQKIKEQTN